MTPASNVIIQLNDNPGFATGFQSIAAWDVLSNSTRLKKISLWELFFVSTFGAEVPVVVGSLPFVLLLQSQKFGSTTCKNDSKTSEVEIKFWKTSTRANPEPRKVLSSQLKLSSQKSRWDFFSAFYDELEKRPIFQQEPFLVRLVSAK